MNKLILTATAFSIATNLVAQEDKRPNILVILADDLGFSDLGCFGGEIATPNLDKMATDGIRVTQMYNSSRSCPTRASLMTGLYAHQAGVGHMNVKSKKSKRPRGYAGFRSMADNVTIAEVLKDADYFTAMAGKWHLGVGNSSPVARGFQEYYGLLGGFTSMWKEDNYNRLPVGREAITYGDDFYATTAITDHALEFIEMAKEKEQPLFLYLAYNAPHFPLHAPKNVIDKYVDIYSKGWDVIRDERWKRIVDMNLMQGEPEMSPRGVVPESFFVHEGHDLPAWNSLSKAQQKDLARRMAIFAAMVDIMDQNIGRVFNALEESGEMENTFVIFMSDNGACAEWHEFGFDERSDVHYKIHKGKELDQMGQPGTYHHYGTGWANACGTPFSYYKHYSFEGGISMPCIVKYGNNISDKGSINHTPLHITDVMATAVELANAKYPSKYQGRKILPLEGRSILPILKNEAIEDKYIFNEHEGNRMVRYGDWKLVSAHCHKDEWELYNIAEDRTEQHNLAADNPEMVKEFEKKYFEWAERSYVMYFPEFWEQYGNTNQVQLKKYKSR